MPVRSRSPAPPSDLRFRSSGFESTELRSRPVKPLLALDRPLGPLLKTRLRHASGTAASRCRRRHAGRAAHPSSGPQRERAAVSGRQGPANAASKTQPRRWLRRAACLTPQPDTHVVPQPLAPPSGSGGTTPRNPGHTRASIRPGAGTFTPQHSLPRGVRPPKAPLVQQAPG